MKKLSMPKKPIVPAGARWDEEADTGIGIGSGRKMEAKDLKSFKK